MSGSEYTPLASLSGKITRERTALHIVRDMERLVFLLGNSAVHEFHELIALIEELKRHPNVRD